MREDQSRGHKLQSVSTMEDDEREEGAGATRSDEEKPAADVDADLQITTPFEKVDTDRGKTKMNQIERVRERLVQEHNTNDEKDTIHKLYK